MVQKGAREETACEASHSSADAKVVVRVSEDPAEALSRASNVVAMCELLEMDTEMTPRKSPRVVVLGRVIGSGGGFPGAGRSIRHMEESDI